jgi:CheY-like chemotaxis protein
MEFNVLVAEPCNDDWASIASGIRRHWPDASILRVKDGEQAVRFLFYRGLLTDAPETPDLIVLAEELPTIASEAVVARLRQHPRTQNTPVIVSRAEKDAETEDALDDHEWLSRERSLVIVNAESLERGVADAVYRLFGLNATIDSLG